MPLTWDANKTNLDFNDENENVKTQTIVLMMPAMGMRSITVSNWKEVYARCMILHRIHTGAFMHLDGKPYVLTPKDVQSRIGLTTNSSPESKAEWAKKIMQGLRSDILWSVRDQNVNIPA